MRLTAAAMLVGVSGVAATHAECRLQPGPARTVTRALDGETLVLDDGSQVRLAGVLAPRGFDAGTDDANWPPAVQARATLAALTVGHTVVLGYSGTAQTDRLGRHAAQVFVVENGHETWVQGQLLCAGLARALQQKDQRGCVAELLAHEKVARDAGAGLWSSGAYQARAAASTRALESMGSKFVVLAGRVAWVAEGRQTIALGFTPQRGRRWSLRRGVTVMIDNADRDLLGTIGGDAKALEGQTVEVRGWLEQRLGRPAGSFVMDVSLAGLLVLAAPAAADAEGAESADPTRAMPVFRSGGACAARPASPSAEKPKP